MGAEGVRTLVVDDDAAARDRLIDLLRYPDVTVVGESVFGSAAYTWAEQLRIDVALVSIEEPVARSLRTVELLSAGAARWPVVGVSTSNDRDLMRKAMLAGARDFIVLPAPGDDLRAAVIAVQQAEQARRTATAAGHPGHGQGTIVTVFGAKGGIGKSVVAVNLAVALAQETSHHVALVDADIQFGDDALMLDVVPTRTIADAAADVDAAKPHLIDPFLTDHPSRLRLLAAARNPSDADAVGPEQIDAILRSLAATHDYVVVDTSPQLDAVTALAIDLSAIVLVMTTPEVPAVRRTRAALQLFDEAGYTGDKIKVVLNRTGKQAEVSEADVVAALGRPLFAAVPDDRAISRSVSLGVPVAMSRPKSSAGKALVGMAQTLGGSKRRRRRFGWPFRRRAHRNEIAPPAPHPIEADRLAASWAAALAAADLQRGAAEIVRARPAAPDVVSLRGGEPAAASGERDEPAMRIASGGRR
ncbi:MAG TPA: AAA family ATPase [Thermomicrobiales bacterium]|nr:AAA family ATPase [Thermomicrobiales bacterium]